MKLSKHTTGRKQDTAKSLQPTDADYKRLRRLLNRPWSPFKTLSCKELSKLAQSFELLEYKPGDIIMQKGVMGHHLYLLEDGSVELFNVKYGQQPVTVATIECDKNRINQVLGKFNDRIFGLTSLRLAVEQPVGARASPGKGPCRVWRMSADAYDISLQNRDTLKELFSKYASVNVEKKPHGSISDSRLSKKMTKDDFFNAMIESDPNFTIGSTESEDTKRSLKALFSIADGDMNDPTGLLSFSEFAALFDLLDHNYSHYDIAFRSFDINRTGYVSRDEFERGIQRRVIRTREMAKEDKELNGDEIYENQNLEEGYDKLMNQNGNNTSSADSTKTSTQSNKDQLVEQAFEFVPNADIVRRYMGASDGKSSDRNLNFGEFSEFFSDLQRELAEQAFEHASDENNCVTFEQAIPLIRMVAPAYNKDYMLKNLTQLLAMYSDSKISYPTFRAFSSLLNKLHYIEGAIYRQCQKKGRKISRSEFANATMIEGTTWTVSDELTPLQFQIMWDVISRSSGDEIGPDDLVTKFKWKGTMKDIQPDQLQLISTPEEASFVSNVLIFFKEFLEHFAIGAIAGGVGAAAVYPIDLGKL